MRRAGEGAIHIGAGKFKHGGRQRAAVQNGKRYKRKGTHIQGRQEVQERTLKKVWPSRWATSKGGGGRQGESRGDVHTLWLVRLMSSPPSPPHTFIQLVMKAIKSVCPIPARRLPPPSSPLRDGPAAGSCERGRRHRDQVVTVDLLSYQHGATLWRIWSRKSSSMKSVDCG